MDPRPTGLGQAGWPTPVRFRHETLWNMALSTRSSSPKCGSGRIHKSRPKGLNQVELGPNPMTTRRFRTQTNLRSNVDPMSNVPKRRRLKPSQSQANRPWGGQQASNCLCWSHATTTDFRKESRASTQRRWPDGHIPRLAGRPTGGRPTPPGGL